MRLLLILIVHAALNPGFWILSFAGTIFGLHLSDNWGIEYALYVLPIAYGAMGYYFVPRGGKRIHKLVNVSIISLLGLPIWGLSFAEYVVRVRSESGAGFIIFSDEISWILYAFYNVFSYLLEHDDIKPLFGDPIYKTRYSAAMMAVNFLPLLCMSVGYGIRSFAVKRGWKRESQRG